MKMKFENFLAFLNGCHLLAVTFISYIPSFSLRHLFYKALGLKTKGHYAIRFGAQIKYPWKVIMGNGSGIGRYANLDGRRGIVIGDHVSIGDATWIWTLEHDYRDPLYGTKGGPVIIEDYAWICSNTVILPDLRIGRGAVVAAGAVVPESIEEYAVVAGIPARKIADRNRDLRYGMEPGPRRFFI